MAISNTYVEPTAGTALNTARGAFNESLRAILTNFKSFGAPGSTQIKIDDVFVGEQDGMLFRSAVTNALYISDSANKQLPRVVGGNFTRWGIGHRVEANDAAISANRNLYEVGELVATLDAGKLYVRTSATDSFSSFKDVGAPQGFTVEAVTNNVTFGTAQSVTALRVNAVTSISVGTSNPTQALDVRGGAIVTGTFTSGTVIANTYNVTSTAHAGSSWTTSGPSVHVRARIYTDTSSSASTVIPIRTSASLFRPSFDTISSGIQVTNASTLYIDGGPTGTTNTTINNSHALHIATNGIYLSSSGTLANPLIALNNPNTGFYAPTTTSIAAVTGGVLAATFSSTGDFTAVGDITAYSDEKLKSNIRTIDNALSKVAQMRGVYFYKDGKESTGVIAQEIQKVLPEVVTDGDYKSVAYGNIVGVLIEAIKELKEEITELKRDR